MDAAGNQVGTGVSPSYHEQRPEQPAVDRGVLDQGAAGPDQRDHAVPARRHHGLYSTAAGGYTWSAQISDSGTLSDKGIQEVAGTAISTLAGVAGVVWEQGNRFYLRGVPVAEDGSTITLGAATEQGYARRPFLLLDSFVARGDAGQPRAARARPLADGYHVRRSRSTRPPARRRGIRPSPRHLPAARCRPPPCTPPGAWWWSTPTTAASAPCCPPPPPRPPQADLHRRTGHPDRAAELPVRGRGHQPRHRPDPRGRRAADRRLRPQRQPRPLLRRRVRRADPALAGHPRAERAGVSRLRPAARLQGQLPRHGRRRLRPDLRALLHGRRIRPRRLPRRRLQRRGRADQQRQHRASTSRTSASTTGAASTPPTTTRSPTRSPARRASTRRSTSPSRRSAASTR